MSGGKGDGWRSVFPIQCKFCPGKQIAKELDAQTGIVMRIMGADKEKGLFSVGVDRTFVHPNGKTGTVKCSRTVLADKLQIVEIQKYYVQFYKYIFAKV